MRILVTGATGFLGTAMCRRLTADGHTVTALGSHDADLRIRGSLDRFTDVYDQIYHLAAWTQAGDFCLKHPGEQWVVNQLINTHVLEWWQKLQPQAKLISMGTSCSYSPDLPLEEKYYLEGTPIESLFTYAHSKRMLLIGQMALQKQYELNWLTLIPSTLYGPGYHTDGRQMHFIFDLIRKILRAKQHGDSVVLWGDGRQKRELVFVDDFVEAALVISGSVSNELVNIGAGEEFEIKTFAEMICNVVGYDVHAIQYDASKYVGAKSKCLAVKKLRTYCPGWTPVPLMAGLRRTIEWFSAEIDGPREST
jgi:GDP-L-fucose synthase